MALAMQKQAEGVSVSLKLLVMRTWIGAALSSFFFLRVWSGANILHRVRGKNDRKTWLHVAPSNICLVRNLDFLKK